MKRSLITYAAITCLLAHVSSAQNCTVLPPANPVAMNVSSCSLTLRWNSVPVAASYSVKVTEQGVPSSAVQFNAGLDTVFAFINLKANTTYVLAVRSICPNGTKSNFVTVKKSTSACQLPDSVSISILPTGPAKISVSSSCPASTFTYQYKEIGGAWNTFSVSSPDSMTISGLEENTKYIYRLSLCPDQSLWTTEDTFLYQRRPNILMIVLDDARFDTYSCNGAPSFFSTPNIDRIAHEGANFKEHFVVYSYCTPGRASLVTGLYPHNHGAEDNSSNIDEGIPTIASLLHDSGYRTGLIGKYFGKDNPTGYDYWLEGYQSYNNSNYNRNGMGITIPGHNTDVLTDTALGFIQANPQPFFLWLGYKAAHTPITPQAAYDGMYDGEIMPIQADTAKFTGNYPSFLYSLNKSSIYLDSAELVDEWERYFETLKGADDAIGKILNLLDSLGIINNTMIIFTSDNGHLFDQHGIYLKWLAYDPSIRVPLFIRYPKMFAPDTVLTSNITLNVDLVPTILEAAGIDTSVNIDGISLYQFYTQSERRKKMLYEFGYEKQQIPYIRAVRDFSFKYIKYGCDQLTEELFDLKNDPMEMNNLAVNPEFATKLQQYRDKLTSLQEQYEDTIRAPISECSLVIDVQRLVGDEESDVVPSIRVQPIPADDYVDIYIPVSTPVRVDILNNTGQVVLQAEQRTYGRLSVSFLPDGIYYARTYAEGNFLTRKFVIAH